MRNLNDPKELYANIHLYTAQMNGLPVVVYIANERVGCGVIEGITEVSVKIGDDRYLRAACTFKYAV